MPIRQAAASSEIRGMGKAVIGTAASVPVVASPGLPSTAASVGATWPDTSVVSMAAMNMANFATVSVASAIRLIATIPTALMAAIRSIEADSND